MASKRLGRAVVASDRRSDVVTDADWRAALGVDYEEVSELPAPWREPADVPGMNNAGEATQNWRCLRAVKLGLMERKKFKVIGRAQPFFAYRPVRK